MPEHLAWVAASFAVFPLNWGGIALSRRGSEKLGAVITNAGIALWIVAWLAVALAPQPRLGGSLVLALQIAGIILILGGSTMAVVASLQVMASVRLAQADPKRLVTSGIYGFVRHPVYGGCVLGYLGWYLLRDSVYGVAWVPVLVLQLRLEAWLEERLLLAPKFGEEFRDYRHKVPTLFPLWLWAIWSGLWAVAVVMAMNPTLARG